MKTTPASLESLAVWNRDKRKSKRSPPKKLYNTESRPYRRAYAVELDEVMNGRPKL